MDQSILLEVSGGLDSSIVAACLRESVARVACCTLVTPVPGADERRYAGLIAAALGIELQSEVLGFDRASVSFDLLPDTVSPRVGCLQHAIDQVMVAAGDQHDVASFYSGAGGDTVFCYLTNAAPAADAIREGGLSAGISAIQDLSALHQCTLWTAAGLVLKKLVRGPKPPRAPRSTFVDPDRIARTSEVHPWFEAPEDALPGDRERIASLVSTQNYRDMTPRGGRKRVRMPLLSQPVVEACLRTPSWMWIAGGDNRAVARDAFADALPSEVLNRRSKGTFVSYLGGVYRRNKEHIRDFLLSGRLREHELLNTIELSRFLARDDLPGRDRLFMEVLDLCMIENWTRQQT